MNRDDIIRMAQEAGFEQLGPDIEDWVCFSEEIERFAALVAAAEREACARMFDGDEWFFDQSEIAAVIRARGKE